MQLECLLNAQLCCRIHYSGHDRKKLLCKVPVHCSPLKQHFLWEILSLGTARDWRLDKDNYWKP